MTAIPKIWQHCNKGFNCRVAGCARFERVGSIRPNPEGRIIENQKAEFKIPIGLNRKAEFNRKAENSTSIIPT